MKADRHFIFPIYAAEAHFTIKQKNYPADWGPPDSHIIRIYFLSVKLYITSL